LIIVNSNNDMVHGHEVTEQRNQSLAYRMDRMAGSNPTANSWVEFTGRSNPTHPIIGNEARRLKRIEPMRNVVMYLQVHNGIFDSGGARRLQDPPLPSVNDSA
jgi:hypothetical protein